MISTAKVADCALLCCAGRNEGLEHKMDINITCNLIEVERVSKKHDIMYTVYDSQGHHTAYHCVKDRRDNCQQRKPEKHLTVAECSPS